jgi:hypothetical protein
MIFDVPVDPDAPQATDWIVNELSKPAYQAAQPTLFDRISKAISDWLQSLQLGGVQGPPALGIAVVVGLAVIGIVVAFLIFGLPRLNRRSAVARALFGDDDARSAENIRRDAGSAAGRGDFSTAVMEMFRAIARGLAERTIVSTSPGTTARGFAARAAAAFPNLGQQLIESASTFDAVRYLDREASAQQFERMAALEAELRATRPTLETVPA